jgi:arylformamidase
MRFIIEHLNKQYSCNAAQPIDISIPMFSGSNNPNAFGIQHPSFEPYKSGNFVASVAAGSPVNCENIFLNPHGNGTHTECVGHITQDRISINDSLKEFLFVARLVTTAPSENLVQAASVLSQLTGEEQAVIIRTLPNHIDKCTQIYSNQNPPALAPDLCKALADKGILHLLVDLPSVDPEFDDGKLTAHRMFWNYPQLLRLNATITEMVFVPDEVKDGVYILNLQIASLQTDASPSKPILYKPE